MESLEKKLNMTSLTHDKVIMASCPWAQIPLTLPQTAGFDSEE